MPDVNGLLGDLANDVHAAVDKAVEAGVPENMAVAHLATLASAWRPERPSDQCPTCRKERAQFCGLCNWADCPWRGDH